MRDISIYNVENNYTLNVENNYTLNMYICPVNLLRKYHFFKRISFTMSIPERL